MKLKRLASEPLLHFLVLGVLLFGLFSWANDDNMRAPDEIVIDAARIAAIESQFQRVWQRPPTPDEKAGLVDNWIREEILYREGVALGLDQNDPVLRRRVAQKMEFISEGLVNSPPTEEQLQAWYEDNADAYRLDPRFSFRQVYFNPSARGDSLEATLQGTLEALQSGEVPAGDPTLLPAGLDDAAFAEVRRTFGQPFAEALVDLPVGTWVGPIESGFGRHLVRIEDRQDARLAAFDEVRAAVERDFLANRERETKDAFYETLKQRYTVAYEDDVTVAYERQGEARVQ